MYTEPKNEAFSLREDGNVPSQGKPDTDVQESPANSNSKIDYLNCSLEEIVRSVYAPLHMDPPVEQASDSANSYASPFAGEAVPFPMNYPAKNNRDQSFIENKLAEKVHIPSAAEPKPKAAPFVEPDIPNQPSFAPKQMSANQYEQPYDRQVNEPHSDNIPHPIPQFHLYEDQTPPYEPEEDTDAIPQSMMPIPKCVSFENDSCEAKKSKSDRLPWFGIVLIGLLVIVLAAGISSVFLWKMEILPSTFLDSLRKKSFWDFTILLKKLQELLHI